MYMKIEPISTFVNVNDVQLHLQNWGGSGEPILIVHATGFLGRLYGSLAERLSVIGHVYSYDHRGHGDSSSSPASEFTWDEGLKDLEALIESMGWKNIDVVGHSMGATISGVLAAQRPDLIRRVVAIDPVLVDWPDNAKLEGFNYMTGPNPMRDRAIKRRRHFESVEAMFADYAAKPQFATWQPNILHDYCEFGTRATADGKRELKCAPEVEAKIFGTAILFHGPDRILKSSQPILFMFADQGSPGAHQTQRILSQMKDSRVLKVPSLGHLMAMEDPDYVAEEVIKFFKSTR